MNLFESQALPEELKRALNHLKFNKPTEVQEASIPSVLEGRDIVGCAQTGGGKTAAFAIPIVAQAIADPQKQFLVLAPTRELAAQIRDVFAELTRFHTATKLCLVVGGSQMRRQTERLKRIPSIIIATPGRLNDHLKRGSVKLSKCSVVVLDEADRMLDMGFGPQIELVLEKMPEKKQTLLFSATLPPKIKKLTRQYLREPQYIEVDPVDKACAQIEQSSIRVDGPKKPTELFKLLDSENVKTLVFTRTKRTADKIKSLLKRDGINADCLHGDRTQSQRERAIARFRANQNSVLVATDIAARGLDVDNVKLIVNYDLPESSDDYIHRIGRTGRAGQVGRAISFVQTDERRHWEYLQNPKLEGQKMKPKRGGNRRPQNSRGGDQKRSFKKKSLSFNRRKKSKGSRSFQLKMAS